LRRMMMIIFYPPKQIIGGEDRVKITSLK